MPLQEYLVMTTDTSMVVVFPGMYQASTRTRLHQSVTITTCVITVYVYILIICYILFNASFCCLMVDGHIYLAPIYNHERLPTAYLFLKINTFVDRTIPLPLFLPT